MKTLYGKQALKRAKLSRKLFNTIAEKTAVKECSFRCVSRIGNNSLTGGQCINYKNGQKKIYYNPNGINYITYKGYSNFYYNGRQDRLAFLKGSIKLNKLFVIAHELGHAIQCQKIGYIAYCLLPDDECEFYADTYALMILKQIKG